MQRLIIIFLSTSLSLFSGQLLAQEEELAPLSIDEKLTLRVLRTSDTKKTVLTNRGLEDGLVVDTHAKFFLTEGVVARGVVVKASPTRAVWSIYRIVDPAALNPNTVMNIKISSALRLTEDPSKAIALVPGGPGGEVMERVSLPGPESYELSDSDQEELDGFELTQSRGPVGQSKSYRDKTWEGFGLLYFNSFSGTYDDLSDSEEVSQSHMAFSLGVEKYFYHMDNFLKNFSLFGFFHSRSSESTDSISLDSSWTEFGGGANYHFYGNPMRSNNLVGYLTASLGTGSVSGTVINAQSEETIEGSNNFFTLGIGGKFGLSNGWGARAILDYYQSGESFAFDDGEETTRSLSGPRVQLGLSYRF